jgi:hypothetical protein
MSTAELHHLLETQGSSDLNNAAPVLVTPGLLTGATRHGGERTGPADTQKVQRSTYQLVVREKPPIS